MKSKRIVVTGGPGTGKTVLISSLENNGYHCFHEVIRTMTLDALGDVSLEDQLVNPIDFVKDAKSFNDELINARRYADLCSKNRYDEVLILPPWKEIYVQDNERMENFEQACGIHAQLENTYIQLGYKPVEVPFGTIENRLQFVIDHINGASE